MLFSNYQLWQKILEGDEKSWEQLVRRYQALVYTVCCNAGLCEMDAADCFQHTWMTLYKNRHKMKNPEKISAWLVTTAKREALRLRRLADRTDDSISEKIHSGQNTKAEFKNPNPLQDEELEILERQALLEIALKQLDKRCREIMEIFFFAPEYYTYEEIAKKLGVASNSVGPLRRRCLEKLKKILVSIGNRGERINY